MPRCVYAINVTRAMARPYIVRDDGRRVADICTASENKHTYTIYEIVLTITRR